MPGIPAAISTGCWDTSFDCWRRWAWTTSTRFIDGSLGWRKSRRRRFGSCTILRSSSHVCQNVGGSLNWPTLWRAWLQGGAELGSQLAGFGAEAAEMGPVEDLERGDELAPVFAA